LHNVLRHLEYSVGKEKTFWHMMIRVSKWLGTTV